VNSYSDWWIEVSDGVFRSVPPTMIKVNELDKWQNEHQSSAKGLFLSVYMYPTSDVYVGGVLSDFYMDFDYKENPDKARKEAVAVIKKLIPDYGIPEGNISIAFSGMKGISVTVDHRIFGAESSADLPLIWKSIAQDLILKLNLKTADTAIYERRRLWRLLNSRHQKSGLYKIPLTLFELENATIAKIKAMALKPREPFIKAEAQPILKAVKLFEEHKKAIEKWLEARKKTFEKTELKLSIDDPPCVKKRLQIGAKVGSRNSFLFQLTIYYAHKGLSEDEIIKIGHEFAKKCEQEPEPFPKAGEIESIVDSAVKGVQDKRYSVGCSSEALADLCDKANCPFFRKPKEEELKQSCGEDAQNLVFEQVSGQEFLAYIKETGEIKREKIVLDFKPLEELLWKPVEGIENYESEERLWSEIKQYLWEHIDIPWGYDVLAAWVLSSWIPERWHAVPYLLFYGPAGSGKTWALEVLASIGFRPFMTASTSLSVIFRACDHWHPTVFLDETESFMRKELRDVIHLLNAGYRKGFPATRVEDTGKGFKVKIFDCFGFKALSSTRGFIQTLKSRCITFSMSKATRKIKTEIDEERAQKIRRKLLAYRFKKISQKEPMEPPDIFTGRLKELFDPLIMVAPLGAKNAIIEEAKKIEQIEREEELASIEALVFKAILSAQQEIQTEKITIEEITRILDETLSPQEMLSPISVGMTASRLGFKKTMKTGKRAIFWNKELAERLAKRYLTGEDEISLTAWLKGSEEGKGEHEDESPAPSPT